ncbi:MAG: BamA/TamA family outer membrane protein [Candidatus Pseudobacter hemicellulosilyticus]|uniref:BamA/TamA family outer membrane protein n=1 Tax=Candidatus Pseudobacter hemicellulosilyticus TaxID=3121375 RepID=A0AAJ5WVN1_9BACT|nr:MAG: BamA/TamA family outer membrane protein [Pseudobacter sp.]
MAKHILFWLLLMVPFAVPAQYLLKVTPVDRDSATIASLKLTSSFRNRTACSTYVQQLPALLRAKGFHAASVDSARYDSLGATVNLFLGEPFRYAYLNTDSIDKKILDAVGWRRVAGSQQELDLEQTRQLQEKILDYLENNGYPFARLRLDSIVLQQDSLYALLMLDKGPLYRIDSIRNQGSASLSSNFLQHYLGIPNGSIFRKDILQGVSRRLQELPYVQEQKPWDLTLLGTGSVLNLYLAPKRSSQVNVLVGFLPDNTQTGSSKLQVTGEANVQLKNSLGNGESIGLNWQQIQVKSPRLNLAFQQPYLFNSPFGVNASFDLFKKDSSFVNIGLLLGVQYAVSANKTGSVFIQNTQSNLLTVDTVTVKSQRALPAEADVRAVNLGVNYEWANTDYRFNPRKGNELLISAAAGTRNIKKNNVIVKLVDAGDPAFDFNSLYDTLELRSYQFRVKLVAAHYFQLTRVSTLKLGVNGGWFESPNIFRNELFQIGGYKLLRGFDEESIYASQYAVGTAEYRYLLGMNSFLFAFTDFGWAKSSSGAVRLSNTYLGAGIGMAFETKAGIFNISYAAGKRDDAKFNLRQSKIHLGYVNYF